MGIVFPGFVRVFRPEPMRPFDRLWRMTRNPPGRGGAPIPTPAAGPIGYTTVIPTAPTGTPSQSPAGSRLIYVSSSTGSDGGLGTIGSPFATLAHAVTFLRDGFPDQLLLACGDTWTLSPSDTGLNYLTVAGQGPGVVGATCSGPMLIGSYQISGNPSTARPLILVSTAIGGGNDPIGIGASASNHGDYLVVQGIEFYAFKRDPANASYSYSEASVVATYLGMRWEGATVNWRLIEDCFVHFFQTNIADDTTTAATNSINLNRCIITDAYNGTPIATQSHSQGTQVNPGNAHGPYNPNPLNISNCFYDQNGWNQTLIATVSSAVASGTTFTWPGKMYVGNGATIYVATTSGNFTAGTAYFVVGTSGNTFSLAATSGGSVISTAGASNPLSMQWADPCANTFNRNFYVDCPATVTYSVSSNSSAEWAEFRSGATAYGNLFFNCSGGSLGADGCCFPAISTYNFHDNVILDATDIIEVPTQQPRSQGIVTANTNSSGTAIVANNIISQATGPSTVNQIAIGVATQAPTCTGVTLNGNIIWKWNQGIVDNGTGTVKIGNVIDLTGANNQGPPEPFPSPNNNVQTYDASIGGPGTQAHFVAQGRLNSRLGGWNAAYTAQPCVNHVRSGFSLGNI